MLMDEDEFLSFTKYSSLYEKNDNFNAFLEQVIYNRTVNRNTSVNRRKVFLDIKTPIKRYLYCLLKTLLIADFNIYIFGHFEIFSKLDRYSQLLMHSERILITFKKEQDSLTISDNQLSNVRLDYDWYSDIRMDKQNIIFPFSMHPLLYEDSSEQPDILLKNKIKILFAGNIDKALYSRLSPKFNLIPRHEVVEFLKGFNFTREVNKMSELNSNQDLSNKLIIADSRNRVFPLAQWLNVLRQTSFFLALPGTVTPLSHNLIEAMSVGSIPIIQYGSYMRPKLKDNLNCISYNTLSELKKKIEYLISVDVNEINRLKQNVLEYYHDYLDLNRFSKKMALLAEEDKNEKFTIFLNAEHVTTKAYLRS